MPAEKETGIRPGVLQVRTDGSMTPSQTGMGTCLHSCILLLFFASSLWSFTNLSQKHQCITYMFPGAHREFWWPSFPVLVYFKVRCAPPQSVAYSRNTMKAVLITLCFLQETQTKPEGQVRPGTTLGMRRCTSHAVASPQFWVLIESAYARADPLLPHHFQRQAAVRCDG